MGRGCIIFTMGLVMALAMCGYLAYGIKSFLVENKQMVSSLSNIDGICQIVSVNSRYGDYYYLEYSYNNISWSQQVNTNEIDPFGLCIGSNIMCWSADFNDVNYPIVIKKIYENEVSTVILISVCPFAVILGLIVLIVGITTMCKEKKNKAYDRL
jgi:hypothetical protein